MRHRPRSTIMLLLLAWPLLLAASDPVGDVGPCPGAGTSARGEAPDLVSARGQIVELGTSALWTLRFADDVKVPDDEGKPFRVDLLLHDPAAPAVDLAYYHDLNRLIRYDAVRDPGLSILLLPERGQNVFLPPKVRGDTMTFQVPGRILSADEDETGTSPGIERVRWTVVVRDEESCDLLGTGRPREPMVPARAEPTTAPDVVAATGSVEPSSGLPTWLWLVGLALAVAVVGVAGARWARRPR